jgi:pimeloyl-ACP methyl ester carboxylesterase
MNKVILLSLIIALSFTDEYCTGQQLLRSASFGAAVSDLTDSSRIALKLSTKSGTVIKKVIDGSSAFNAGFAVNDVLVSMDDESIENTAYFLQLLKKHHGGDKIKIGYYRNSKLTNTVVNLLAKQMESSNDFDIIYSSVVSGSNHLRTIITKPKGNGIYPAVLLISGIGCYSIDNISVAEIKSLKMWVDSLTMNGFVTIRVEKTGMGDSQGIPCSECDFDTEKQGFADGLKQLKSLPYVDKEKIFIAGFSIGGIIAPLIAQKESIKGIIVYGTVGRNWLEYELDNTLRQQLLENRPADSIDIYMRGEYIRLFELFVEKKAPEQIMKEHPETKSHLFTYPMRTEYFQQVADVNIHELWMKTKVKVLSMHGSSDFVSSASEHKQIAETVNQYHPGNATYVEIPNADHWSLNTESEFQSLLQQTTDLNTLPLTTSLKWLKDNS